MTAKRSIRDLERQCKKEPDNLVLRLLLAAAYREAGRTTEAVPLYRSVANSYQQQGRRTQAVAVLRSLLEIDPADPDTRALLGRIDPDAAGATATTAPPTTTPPAGSPIFPVTYPAPPPPPSPPPQQQQLDQERPSTIPSLDGQRLRKSGQHPSARVLAEDIVLRDLAPVRPSGQSGTRPLTPLAGTAPGGGPGNGPVTIPDSSSPGVPAGPPLARLPLATLAGLGLAGPGVRGPSPTRGSSAQYTPTPLPTPVPFHEVDRTGPIEAPAQHDDDAATRIADAFRPARRGPTSPPPLRPATGDTTGRRVAIESDRARPTATDLTGTDLDLASELDTRRVRRLSEAELDVLSEPPPGHTDQVAQVDASDLDEETDPDASPMRRPGMIDDEPTRIADDRATAPSLSRPSNEFDVPTGVHRAATPLPTGAAAPVPRAPLPPRTPTRTTRVSDTSPTPVRGATRATTPRATTPRATASPPPRSTSRRAASPTPTAMTPPPDSDHADEPTRVTGASRDSDALPPPPRGHLTPPPSFEILATRRPDTATAPDVARLSEPGMHRSHAFDRSFTETLEEMDPDGAAIEAPLDMFSMLPPEALTELSRGMLLRRFNAGDNVIREGDPGDACYVIVDGEVRVLKNDPLTPDAGPTEVARLGPRSLFGEFALLADRRRHATVQATTHCDLYEIPRQLLRQLAANYPDVGPALESFYRQRLLATLLRTAPFFAPLPEDNRARLLGRFQPIRAEPGEAIVREGHPAGGLYLIVLGAVEITRRLGRNRSVILASLHEGAYFGEMSLLSGDPTTATVIAAGPVELALLPPRDFYEIVAEHPELWAAIRREARSRALENAKLVAGETGTV